MIRHRIRFGLNSLSITHYHFSDFQPILIKDSSAVIMAWIGKIFGTSGRKGNPMPTPQEAIQKLRETEDMLMKKQEFLEKKITQEIATAKRHGTKNKRCK